MEAEPGSDSLSHSEAEVRLKFMLPEAPLLGIRFFFVVGGVSGFWG